MIERKTRVPTPSTWFVFVGTTVDSVLGCAGVQTPHSVASLYKVFPDIVAVRGTAGRTAFSRPVVREFYTFSPR